MARSIESLHLAKLHVVREEPDSAELSQPVLDPGELLGVSLLPGQVVDPAHTGLSHQADPGSPLLVETRVLLGEDGGDEAGLGAQHQGGLG